MSSSANKKKRDEEENDDGDGVFDDEDDDSEDEDDIQAPAAKKRKKQSFMDDAAEESGDEDEEEDDSDNNDYVKDDFVVDEGEEETKKKGDLEDSDDDEADDETPPLKMISKMRPTDRLDEDDFALIQEAADGAGEEKDELLAPEPEEEPRRQAPVVAKTEAELRKGLFRDSDDEDQNKVVRKPTRVERYDEDGMDDFIEDDVGDQDAIRMADRKSYAEADSGGVNEAQLIEASEIFGTDYLEFMQEENAANEEEEEEDSLMGKKYRERGVGVSYDLGSDDEIISDEEDEDDDDLFGDEEDDGLDGEGAQQKAEALRLKREKRKLAKAERRRQAAQKKAERRKARFRRAFEPVQLVENFCTERDDVIRQADVPERFYDWKVPFHGSDNDGMNAEEKIEAQWIATHHPDIASELAAAEESEERQHAILSAIANALRFMHRDKMEPAFIKRYRKDYITSSAVLSNLDYVMDADGEYDRMVTARSKVEALLDSITNAANADESVGADAQQELVKLQEELEHAQKKLDETAKQESQVKVELEAVTSADDDDDDDDELFGGDDDDDDEEKKKEKVRLSSHLATIQSLLEAHADKVSQLQERVQAVDAKNRALERITKKMSRDRIWNSNDYAQYFSSLTEARHILDVNGYLNLIKEGNDAIRKKEMPMLENKDGKNEKRRSRRFDRDFYRYCVSEGLRNICYRFLLAPNRVGIKLEDTVKTGKFDFTKTMPGEENVEGSGDPLKWVSPTIPSSTPSSFASDLIGSGDLVLLSSTSGGVADANEAKDPLRGCRYVAALELANEPRVRRYLRDIYRRHAVLTTKPTIEGRDEIDAFHDFYGLHLVKGKPVKNHFPLEEREAYARRAGLSIAEINELDLEIKKKEKDSCLQYLNMLKAESTGYISVHVHLPLIEQDAQWYKMDPDRLMSRDNQDVTALMSVLTKVYLHPDADASEWEDERKKVLQFALMNFLLPQFEAEARRDLRDAATKLGVAAAAENLRAMAMEGPYRPEQLSQYENRFLVPTGGLPIVGVCCTSDGKDATYLASVTERGASNDYLAVPSGMRVDSNKMREKVITFLLQSRPAAVVVGTSGGFASRFLQRKLGDMITEAVSRWNKRDIQGDDEDDEAFEARQSALRQLQTPSYYDDEDEEDWKCNVELVDDSVAQLYGRSVRSKKEFPDYAVNLKCAISVARYAKDPLAELTYAWSVASDAGMFGTEMLFLNIYPMQQLLPKTSLLREYERVLCDVVADVGADLNACCASDHLSGLLMFIAGLGPRKAANLKQIITKMGGAVARRSDLLDQRLLGPVVYNNAVAFLRIRDVDQLEGQFLHPLDETRVHPDVYNNWAVKIAFDALERDDQRNKESVAIKALRDVMDNSSREVERLFKATKAAWEQIYGPTFDVKKWDPKIHVPCDLWEDKVETLDLDAFADLIEKNGRGRWHSQLDMIKWEFRLPFVDPRIPMQPLANEKLFHLITGETDQSLRPGKEVTGKVIQNGDFGSRVKLEGGIRAFIPLRNMSDDHVERADDYVSAGQVVTAVVTEVNKYHMTVDMSLKMEAFHKNPGSWERPKSLPSLDPHFDMGAASRIEEDDDSVKETKKKGDLEDSGDYECEDDDEVPRLEKIRKMRATDRLDEEDLALIQEARRSRGAS